MLIANQETIITAKIARVINNCWSLICEYDRKVRSDSRLWKINAKGQKSNASTEKGPSLILKALTSTLTIFPSSKRTFYQDTEAWEKKQNEMTGKLVITFTEQLQIGTPKISQIANLVTEKNNQHPIPQLVQ